MAAATVAGVYPAIEAAQRRMGNGFEKEYRPNAGNAAHYRTLYERYRRLGAFIDESFTVRG